MSTKSAPLVVNKIKAENKDIYPALKKIKELAKQGIPIYTAGGNESFDNFNPFGCVKGVYSIGATDVNGDIEAYSAKSSLTGKYKQGTFNVTYSNQGEIKLHVNDSSPIKISSSICTFDKNFSKEISGKTYDDKSYNEINLEYDLYDLNEIFSALKEYYQYQYKNNKDYYRELPDLRFDTKEAVLNKGKFFLKEADDINKIYPD